MSEEERKERLDRLMQDFFRDEDRLASSADEKCQKVYDHMKILVAEKEALQARLAQAEDKESRKTIKREIQRIDAETNDLLNLLSQHSMQF